MLPALSTLINSGAAHALMGSLLSSISGTQPHPTIPSRDTKRWSDINDIVNTFSPALALAGPAGLVASMGLPLVMQAFKPKSATGSDYKRGLQIANNIPVEY